MRWPRWLALFVAFCASLAPMAHVLELPNKLRLEGPLWLAVQQQLYNGRGPLIGSPTVIGGMIINLVLLAAYRGRARPALLFGPAGVAYGAMLLSFFLFNAPVNEAVDKWTPETLPADWATYRLRWEIGHSLAALFALLGLVAVGSAIFSTRTSDHNGECARRHKACRATDAGVQVHALHENPVGGR